MLSRASEQGHGWPQARQHHIGLKESLMPWFREWVTIEQEATALCSFQPLVVPGLLQTEEYARALYEGASHLVGDQVEQPLAARLDRQKVLDRPNPPLLVAVLDYTVLERPVGGPKVMREQLRHLVTVGNRTRVHLHVVPRGVGAYPGLNGAFVIATTTDGDDLAYLDNQLRGAIAERSPSPPTPGAPSWRTPNGADPGQRQGRWSGVGVSTICAATIAPCR
ncbi:DUF5753 domain-containing protein [Micromonospora sp. CP22]|uniref:DUF5753 domain-containing protein n=1 Tax=Micromonospora sp. CP22 TaxID=2580517 RepID=UPI001E4D1A77|nr:DUF5753 domain-containing protein [Micromonospora sp. CP22]